MVYVIEFMFYSLVVISLIGATGLLVTWYMDGKKVDLMDWIKTF